MTIVVRILLLRLPSAPLSSLSSLSLLALVPLSLSLSLLVHCQVRQRVLLLLLLQRKAEEQACDVDNNVCSLSL